MAKSLDIIDPKKELDNDSPREEDEKKREEKVIRAQDREEKESGGGAFYLVIGIIAVVVSASLALYILFKDNDSSKNTAAKTSATATATETASDSATAIASATMRSEDTATSSNFKYTDEQIRIANGNSISGEASRIKDVLETKGFSIASIGNASKQYDASIVYYKTGHENLANAIKSALAGEYIATIEASDTTVGSYDAVIVLGAK